MSTVRRKTRMFQLVMVTLLLLTSATLAKLPIASAQSGTPQASQPCLCEQVKAGLTLLAKYKIPPTALNELVPLLNNEAALRKRLSSFGLTEDQVNALLQEADPMIKAVRDSGGVPDKSTLGDKANALLDKYGIPHDALAQLLPLLNDQEALTATLGKLGLNADAIKGLLTEAAPLIQEGLSTGAIQDYIIQSAHDVFDKYHVPQDLLDDYLALKGDPKAIADFLTQNGLSDDEQKAFDKDLGEDKGLGLNTNALDYQLGEQAVALLGKYKLPPSALGELIPLLTDKDALIAKLSGMGLDQSAIQGLLTEATPLIKEGLSSGAVDRFIAQQTQDLMDRLGIPEEAAADFIAAGKDPTEMKKFLDDYGVSSEEVTQAQQDMKEVTDLGVSSQDVEKIGADEQSTDQNLSQEIQQEDNSGN